MDESGAFFILNFWNFVDATVLLWFLCVSNVGLSTRLLKCDLLKFVRLPGGPGFVATSGD